MGSLDSAESTDLVALFVLYNLSAYQDINIDNIGLYRDDGHIVVKNSTKLKADNIRKLIHREFKSFNIRSRVTYHRLKKYKVLKYDSFRGAISTCFYDNPL